MFRDTTCLWKELYLKPKKLLLKHMYDSVSLLNDISRNVHNIDYTRDMSWEEYFWIFVNFQIFMDFISFIFFYFSFWFYNLYTRIQISLRGCWHEYRNESIVQLVVEVCSQHLLNFHHQSFRGSRIIIWTCAFSMWCIGSFPQTDNHLHETTSPK